MSPSEIESEIRHALVSKGFTGIIALKDARRIAEHVIRAHPYMEYVVKIDISPVHYVGKVAKANCGRSVIKVLERSSK